MSKSALVIVESPAKAKTIGKYLGSGFKVKASMGHLRDLPKSSIGVDIDNGFVPEYIPLKGREDIIRDLKESADDSDLVYLATDPDREGEAISWHLKELLGLPDEKTHRITFNEITKKAVSESVENPRAIDINLVDAQQARRVLDRIVGYQLSPLLWKKIRRGLSAGRVQSVTTRMVVDREEEIRAFIKMEYWTLDAMLEGAGGQFKARLWTKNGKKYEPESQEETEAVIAGVKETPLSVASVKVSEKRHTPTPPFITSTLQQEASRRLGMTPRRTMTVAQQLYEGIEIAGTGAVGLITYMRTDSQRVSDEAKASASAFIAEKYGKDYCGSGNARQQKSKIGAQDAHEAIRPSDLTLEPDAIKDSLSSDQYKLYRLIWLRFIASQMAVAVYKNTAVDITAGDYTFHAADSELVFPGYTAIYEESRDEEKEEQAGKLPVLSQGEALKLLDTMPLQHFTQPPARYSEATLVKAMEELGVGRPSTYAATVSIILDREYVIKEGKTLAPTPLGEVVTNLMKDKFSNIVDTDFTANMEKELDKVEEGLVYWKDLLKVFYEEFHKTMLQAEEDLKEVRIKVPDEVSDEVCDLCGRQMVVKVGRFGKFLACPDFPNCKFTKPIVVEMPGRCPVCGGRILKKTSKKGYAYYGCEKYPTCSFMTWDVPVKEDCPVCGHTMFKKTGRGHKKPYCINEECANFTPEDKRGGYKKPVAADKEADAATAEEGEKKAVNGKKKVPAKKGASAAKKTASAKSAGAKKTAAGKSAGAKKKTPAKKVAKKT